MCILFIAVEQHETFPLIIAANRDEFYKRPTTSSHVWQDTPEIIAGQDELAGGTWMGMNSQGRLSALTNIRAPHTLKDNAKSRGELVLNYLQQQPSDEQYTKQLRTTAEHYNGYNLLFGNWNALKVYNNHTNELQSLSRGYYGLSNADLNSPWPKINKGVQALKDYCDTHVELNEEKLFDLLRDNTKAEDHMLPKTGVPEHWEKQLSSIFINTPEYGTRSSTLLSVRNDGKVHWVEHVYNDKTQFVSEQRFESMFR